MKFAVPLLMFILLSAPAVKLLFHARRDRGGPEVWAGLFFLGAGSGMPLRMMGATLIQDGGEPGVAVNVAGHLCLLVSSVSLTVFTWKVFHSESTRVRAIAVGLIALQLITTLYAFGTGTIHAEEGNPIIAINAMRVVPTAWACVESIRYWMLMRRRVALGLADPVVSNRFALWAIWTAAFAALPTTSLVLRIVVPTMVADPNDPEVIRAVMDELLGGLRVLLAVAGLLGLVALVLSFFPPHWYLARLRAGLPDTPVQA